MFFVLSKTVARLLIPSNFLLLVGLAGLLLLVTRYKHVGRRLTLTSLALFLALGILPVGGALDHVLESRFPAWDPARGAPDGIVVLGGAIDPVLSRARGQVALSDAAERITALAKLARDYPRARVVFSSGDASVLGDQPAEADFIYPLLDSFGVPRTRVTLEDKARNTAENAAFTKALVRPKAGERWLLVTSARHMPRAVGCFRRVGFPVEAYPVDWQTMPRWRPWPSFDVGATIAATDKVVREWEGLIVYRLTGRTGAFFPAP
jgi:uncharacterized SAM-binding protein YcdF (DUF218 family)